MWWGYIAKIFVKFVYKSVQEGVPVGQGYRPRALDFPCFFVIFMVFWVAENGVYPGYIRDISDVQDGASGARPGASGARPGASGARPGASGARPGASGARPGASVIYSSAEQSPTTRR